MAGCLSVPLGCAVLAALLGAGCGGAGPQLNGSTCSGASASLSTDVAPIIVSRCSGGENCHGGFGGPSKMHAQLVGVLPELEPAGCMPPPRVTPGDPARSYLMNKLLGEGMCAGTQQMPLGDSLPRGQIQTIADWICAGAPDD